MDKQFLDLEITLLSMEGNSIPRIAKILGIEVEEVISSRNNRCFVNEDSDEFAWS